MQKTNSKVQNAFFAVRNLTATVILLFQFSTERAGGQAAENIQIILFA